MTSPFPGMDPYLEISGDWRDFHSRLLNACADQISESLPDGYIARIEMVEEVKDRWIEIRRKPDWVPVAVLEVLSPNKKSGHGYEEYLHKRVSMIARSIHLVEVDLLLGGRRLPMARPLPPGDYYAFVSRTERRPVAGVYSWSIRDPLPTIPIPLMLPDPDIPLNLAPIFATVYQRSRYDRSIDYHAPLPLPLGASDRIWAEELARTRSS
jgi:hypothetical protein